ncbi:uncharacterized protein LOC129586558 [Paramacrobiotus metropolitanus]|uniref:uncharacterized protein LOC129586558 n=1 Tax=Paramacrobiotus metropolitanus TaxID=2943436 RepID=UPI0024457A43|nr:uncharacterized protein LOC129586558 [Paramacrobiotus metropolitanus]
MNPEKPPIASESTVEPSHILCNDGIAYVNEIPEELLIKIFRRIDVFTQKKLRQVCKKWNGLLKTKSIRKYVILDLSVCLTDIDWLYYTDDWCAAFMGPDTEYLSILCGNDLDNISDAILRHFFSEGCRWAVLHCPQLRRLTIVGGKIDVRCFLELPRTVQSARLLDVLVGEQIEPGVYNYYSVKVDNETIDLWDVRRREENVAATLERHAAPLLAEEMHRLQQELPGLTGELQISTVGLLQRREPRFQQMYCVDLSRVDLDKLKVTTVGMLYKLIVSP